LKHKVARIWLCAALLIASLFLTVGGDSRLLIAEPPDTPEPTATTSESTQQTASSYTATPNLVITVTSVVTTTSNGTTTVVSISISKLTTTQTSETMGAIILDLPDIWTILILVVGLAFSIGFLLLVRSRYRGQLDELRKFVNQLKKEQGRKTSETASSALKRLLELGVIQPKEYIEKKMLAERLEKKTSIEKLLEEGLISKDQYDALIQKAQD